MHGDWPFDMQILRTSGVISVLFNAPMFYVCGERSHNFIFGPSINRSASFSVVDVQLIKVCICIYSNTGSCHSHVPARNRSTHVSALCSVRELSIMQIRGSSGCVRERVNDKSRC